MHLTHHPGEPWIGGPDLLLLKSNRGSGFVGIAGYANKFGQRLFRFGVSPKRQLPGQR